MNSVLKTVGRLTQGLLGSFNYAASKMIMDGPIRQRTLPVMASCFCKRADRPTYDPYPEYETPSPFKKQEKYDYGYKYKYYTGGVLPRPEGKLEDVPLPMPRYDPRKKDQWTRKKALFGQNDYIDILGDGTVQPWQTMKGPLWLRAFKGNEFQRLLRMLKFRGSYLQEFHPTRYHDICKRINFLYKRLNRRQHAPFRHGTASARSRIDNLRDF